MNEAERWERVLEAHADEHHAMRDRGIARVSVYGRPKSGMGATVQMPEPFHPYSLHQVNLSPYEGLGALTSEQKVRAVYGLGAAALLLGLVVWGVKQYA